MHRHRGNRGWHAPGRPSHAGVIEQNDVSLHGERIRDRRIPIVERPGEVLKTQERASVANAETAVGIRFVFHFEELRWGRDVAGDRGGCHLMTSVSGVTLCGLYWGQLGKQLLERDRKLAHPYAGGIEDSVGHGRPGAADP